jgi:hypothetical protein
LDQSNRSLGALLGYEGRALEAFVAGQPGSRPNRAGFDGMVDMFAGMGMTEAGAKAAAIGHHSSEQDAREDFDSPAASVGLHAALDALATAYERFHGFTPAEAVNHARGECAKLVVTYDLTVEALTGRVRELASTLNAARPAASGPTATAAAMTRPTTRGVKAGDVVDEMMLAHQRRHAKLLREAR